MSKNIYEIAAEWEERVEEIYASELGEGEDFSRAEIHAYSGELDTAWAEFEYEHDLFDVDECAPFSFGISVQERLESHFGLVDTDDGETIGESGTRFLKSLPNAEIRDGVYAVMDDDGLIAHIAVLLRERLSNGYYDCDDVCAREGECDHADLRAQAEREAA